MYIDRCRLLVTKIPNLIKLDLSRVALRWRMLPQLLEVAL